VRSSRAGRTCEVRAAAAAIPAARSLKVEKTAIDFSSEQRVAVPVNPPNNTRAALAIGSGDGKKSFKETLSCRTSGYY